MWKIDNRGISFYDDFYSDDLFCEWKKILSFIFPTSGN